MTSVEALRAELEVARLAHELGASPDDLSGLTPLPAAEIAHLRRQLSAGLVAHHAHVFDVLASASALVPARLAALATRTVIGPTLAGRLAGSMSGDRTAAILRHLDAAFVAACCRTLSADAAAALLPAIDDDRVAATTAALVASADHATLGRLVAAVDDERLPAVLAVVDRPADLLLAGAAADEDAALDRVVAALPPARRVDILTATLEHPDEGAGVLVRLQPASRGLLLESVTELDDASLLKLLEGLTATVRASRVLRAAAASLPKAELARASDRLNRNDALGSAIDRLAMTVLGTEDTDD